MGHPQRHERQAGRAVSLYSALALFFNRSRDAKGEVRRIRMAMNRHGDFLCILQLRCPESGKADDRRCVVGRGDTRSRLCIHVRLNLTYRRILKRARGEGWIGAIKETIKFHRSSVLISNHAILSMGVDTSQWLVDEALTKNLTPLRLKIMSEILRCSQNDM